MSKNGKWMCITDEEHWSSNEEFDSREEALAYATTELVLEDGLEVGDHVYTGQVREITAEEIAVAGERAWNVVENLQQWLYDNVGEDYEDALDVSKADEDELQVRLNATILGWLKDRDIKPSCYRIEHVESHMIETLPPIDPDDAVADEATACGQPPLTDHEEGV